MSRSASPPKATTAKAIAFLLSWHSEILVHRKRSWRSPAIASKQAFDRLDFATHIFEMRLHRRLSVTIGGASVFGCRGGACDLL
mmetsp:Transcript_1717/g.2433  ORF Transcript_1717/g.2433 Transcript_1717/m.2433 type:complete len:84 (-) Transcript_1717:15-266(-)